MLINNSQRSLPRTRPADSDVDGRAIRKLVDALRHANLEIHSLMLVRHGAVVAEACWTPYRADEPHLLYSLTKSFCSTAVGFAIAEGFFGLDDRLVDHFSDLVPSNPDPNLANVTVRHLLTMSVGHDTEPDLGVATGTWASCVERFLAHPVPHPPGEHFLYNTAASNVLSILVQKTSGERIDRFLKPRLLDPLGIEQDRWTYGADFAWGGSGLYVTTETIAKFGQLYLDKGKWAGVQVLPVGWAEMATARQVSNGDDPASDWAQGYGFQFWRCRHNALRGDGAFGQFCLVLPEHDAVIAMTSGEADMQAILNAIWTHLLPGFDAAAGADDLTGFLSGLVLAPCGVSAGGPTTLHLLNSQEGFHLALEAAQGCISWKEDLPFALDSWTECQYAFGHGQPVRASVRGQWITGNRLQVKVVNLSTPNHMIFTIEMSDAGANVTIEERGHFQAIEPKRLSCSVQ